MSEFLFTFPLLVPSQFPSLLDKTLVVMEVVSPPDCSNRLKHECRLLRFLMLFDRNQERARVCIAAEVSAALSQELLGSLKNSVGRLET